MLLFNSHRFDVLHDVSAEACFRVESLRSEAHCHHVLASRSLELRQTRVATARVVADATLPEVEVSEHLLAACQVVRVLATVEHVVVELLVVVVREREGELTIHLHVQLQALAVVSERQFAQALTVEIGRAHV